MLRRFRLLAPLLALVLAVASLSQVRSVEVPPTPAMAAYLAAGGDLSAICGGGDAGATAHCPLCILAAASVSSTPEIALRSAGLVRVAFTRRPTAPPAISFRVATPIRGPPFA